MSNQGAWSFLQAEPLADDALAAGPATPERFLRAPSPASPQPGDLAASAASRPDPGGSSYSDVRYFWREATVPDRLEITQVYGYLLCPETGRVLVQDDGGTWNLPGGTPEVWDADLAATLVREAFEENQVRIGPTAYLGYQEVCRRGRAPYAQVRMAGVIEEFAPRAPDPDGGRTYRRLMTSLEAAPCVLGWGEPAVLQARAAARVARAHWRLPVDAPAAAGYVD